MPAFNEIAPDALMRLVGTPDCPILVDVSNDDDFDADPYLVPTAFRHRFDDTDALIARLRGRDVVVICQKGRKLSQGAAAHLRARAIAARVLSGGNLGWKSLDLPRVPAAKIHKLWVTRHRPKIDRIACPWLIRRFVDPAAIFMFTPPDDVLGVAEHFRATPFDMLDVPWSHRGDACTFDTMIAEFGLQHPALDVVARIVRAADTDRHDLSTQAAGLLALSVGMSRLHRDDQAQLDASMVIYDALYRWARDGQSEGHEWPVAAAT